MRISSKGRYALAAAVHMAERYSPDVYIPLLSVADSLGLSKIYLEQIFSQLKRAGIVSAAKGSQGGYVLAKSPDEITAFDVLLATEPALFETSEVTAGEKMPEVAGAIFECVMKPLDKAIKHTLSETTLADIVAEVAQQRDGEENMFYI
ncbi:MAG TPA: Rrf2 family transcriptional regulator [Bacillota bacterium]|nr:Rrf2 family transcriptional regulator [Clostridiales bacterium]HPU17186.1 Rrf2 family transcriptional regulator [Bacillota bacterium]